MLLRSEYYNYAQEFLVCHMGDILAKSKIIVCQFEYTDMPIEYVAVNFEIKIM